MNAKATPNLTSTRKELLHPVHQKGYALLADFGQVTAGEHLEIGFQARSAHCIPISRSLKWLPKADVLAGSGILTTMSERHMNGNIRARLNPGLSGQ